MLLGTILMLTPHSLSTKLQMILLQTFRAPISSGRWIALAARTTIQTRGLVPSKDYESLLQEHKKLLNYTKLLEKRLQDTSDKLDQIARIRQVRPWERVRTIAARVIARLNNNQVLIGAGRTDGLTEGAFVVAESEVLGRVTALSSHTARVELLTSTASILKTIVRPSNVTGSLRGNGDGTMSIHVKAPCQARIGETVFLQEQTVMDVPAGSVVASQLDQTNPLLWLIKVRPRVDIDHLNTVWVLVADQ